MDKNNIKQYFNVKFPFTSNNEDGFFIDLNTNYDDKISSYIAHVLLTQKGTRLRMPDFGTNLINFIFSPSDETSWNEVESEIKESVSKYVKNTQIKKVSVIRSEGEDNTILVDIYYSVKKGEKEENNRMVLKI